MLSSITKDRILPSLAMKLAALYSFDITKREHNENKRVVIVIAWIDCRNTDPIRT